ncbi:MAG: DUF427 domain-containing protein [Bacteroidia bacterium]|nr:DUF427 domain-containing protein [Bacteroidia bacterium]
MKAIWNGQIIAESKDTVVVEGNHYFPKESLKQDFFRDSELSSVCPWKGTASYYHVNVDGKINADAAWYYPETSTAAKKIEGRIAFWKGVQVTE